LGEVQEPRDRATARGATLFPARTGSDPRERAVSSVTSIGGSIACGTAKHGNAQECVDFD
jgi:hypothetical protein